MQEIMEKPQITAAEKSKLYLDQLNWFLTFKNKENHHLPVKAPHLVNLCHQPLMSVPEITPRVPATPKSDFLRVIFSTTG